MEFRVRDCSAPSEVADNIHHPVTQGSCEQPRTLPSKFQAIASDRKFILTASQESTHPVAEVHEVLVEAVEDLVTILCQTRGFGQPRCGTPTVEAGVEAYEAAASRSLDILWRFRLTITN